MEGKDARNIHLDSKLIGGNCLFLADEVVRRGRA
jgi:hypothetical protein